MIRHITDTLAKLPEGKFWEKYPATEYELTEHGKQRRAKGLCQKK